MTITKFTCYIFVCFLFSNRLAVVPLRAPRKQGNIESVLIEMEDFDATQLASVEVLVKSLVKTTRRLILFGKTYLQVPLSDIKMPFVSQMKKLRYCTVDDFVCT